MNQQILLVLSRQIVLQVIEPTDLPGPQSSDSFQELEPTDLPGPESSDSLEELEPTDPPGLQSSDSRTGNGTNRSSQS